MQVEFCLLYWQRLWSCTETTSLTPSTFSSGITLVACKNSSYKGYLWQEGESSTASGSMVFVHWLFSHIGVQLLLIQVGFQKAWKLHFKVSTWILRIVKSVSAKRLGSRRGHIIAGSVASVYLKWIIIVPGWIIASVIATWNTFCSSWYILCFRQQHFRSTWCLHSTTCWYPETHAPLWETHGTLTHSLAQS